MPDSPMEAKFLKHEEKLVAIERLRMNQMGVASRVWKWDHVQEAFLDVKTWLWFSMLMAISSVHQFSHEDGILKLTVDQGFQAVASLRLVRSSYKLSASIRSQRFSSISHSAPSS